MLLLVFYCCEFRSTWKPAGAFSWRNGLCCSSESYSCAATI